MVKCECPSCFLEIQKDERIIKGQVSSCPECGVDSEITKIEREKVELIITEFAEEDWGE